MDTKPKDDQPTDFDLERAIFGLLRSGPAIGQEAMLLTSPVVPAGAFLYPALHRKKPGHGIERPRLSQRISADYGSQ